LHATLLKAHWPEVNAKLGLNFELPKHSLPTVLERKFDCQPGNACDNPVAAQSLPFEWFRD
jgi:hypothetical protein